MDGRRSARFCSDKRIRAIAPIVGTLILIVVVVTAVGSFAYVLTAFQSQNENSQAKLSGAQNDKLQISFVQLSPADPGTQFQFQYSGGTLYVHYASETSVNVYDFGSMAYPGTLVTLDGSYAQIQDGLGASIDLSTPPQISFASPPPAGFTPITFQGATWNSVVLTVANDNTQNSGLAGVSVNGIGATSFTELDLSSGGTIMTFFSGQAPIGMPPMGSVSVKVNLQNFDILKSSTVNINVLSSYNNLFSDVLQPPNSLISSSQSEEILSVAMPPQVTTDLDGSRSLSSAGSIQNYIWRIDVPVSSGWNGSWNDYGHIETAL